MKALVFILLFAMFIGCSPLSRLESNNSPWCTRQQLENQYIAHWKNGQVTLVNTDHIESWLRESSEDLKRIEPNYRIQANEIFPARFPDTETWTVGGLRNTLGTNSAWKRKFYGQGILVAVVDSGVDISHSFLNNRIYRNPKESGPEFENNGIDDDHNGYVDDAIGWNFVNQTPVQHDEIGHGTVIAGLITGGRHNLKNLAVAPQAKILPVDFMDANGGSEYHAYLALDYAVNNGAHIINNSWSMDCSSLLDEKFREWESKNIIFVNAAGNMGINAYSSRKMPASLTLMNFLNVGSTTRTGQKSYFSNFGPSINIYAPGQDIPVIPSEGAFPDPASGTSLSAGVVSGAAAAVWSAFPNATAQQIIQILVSGRAMPQGQAPRLSIGGAIKEGHKKGYHRLTVNSPPLLPLSKSLKSDLK